MYRSGELPPSAKGCLFAAWPIEKGLRDPHLKWAIWGAPYMAGHELQSA
jgi:hypothetical protein